MADYTYKELMKMQNDAIRRVEDMQKRARQTAGLNENKNETSIASADKVKRIPQPSGYLDASRGDTEAKGQRTLPVGSLQATGSFDDRLKKMVGELNIDSDKALLLSLIMLLSEENADELLIMALIYMLT